jgi:hypothetical protein
MSNILPDFIHNVGYLYEEMNIQDQDFLNENSEYYDPEMSYLVEDILSSISTSMIYEGYSASAIIGFLADSSTQDILEKYLTFDENILLENTISEDYIQEQLEIFDYCIDEGLGSLVGKVAKGAASLAGRIASKPARSAVAKKLATSANPEKTRVAMQRLAQREARKANVGGYSKTQSPIGGGKPMSAKQSAELLTKAKIGQVAQKVKDIATKAKPALQKVGKGVGIFGLGAAGGYMGAKMAGAGTPTSSNAPGVSSGAPGTPGAPGAPGGGGSPSGRGGGSATPSKPSKPSAPQKPKSPADAKSEWEKANPRLAQAEKLRQQGASRQDINKVLYNKGTAASQGSGESQMEKDAEELRKMTNRSKQRQGQLMGGPEGPGRIDTKAVEADIKAAQEREKEKLKQKAAEVAKESYDAYEIVLDYLVATEQVETIDEAHYVMLEMDENAIGVIIEHYEDYLLAEEVSKWVDSLLEEGYDLSEYTWDDIIEYYVNEAREDEGLTPLQKIRKRNKNYAIEGEPAGDQTSNRRAEHSSQRGVKKQKGKKSAFGTMRHVGGPYKD